MAYSAYVIEDDQRWFMLSLIPAVNKKVIAHHVTVQFPVDDDSDIPQEAVIRVIGERTIPGIQILVCTVDGILVRNDGSVYHITWSLDPEQYKPVDSNRILEQHGWVGITPSFEILTTPAILD